MARRLRRMGQASGPITLGASMGPQAWPILRFVLSVSNNSVPLPMSKESGYLQLGLNVVKYQSVALFV